MQNPVLATAMTEAIQKAGLPTMPVIERVWRFMKDHPGKTPSDIALTLKIKLVYVYTALYHLRDGGQAKATKDLEFIPKAGKKAFVTRWTALGNEYEQNPPKLRAVRAKKRAYKRGDSQAVQAKTAPATVAVDVDVGKLTYKPETGTVEAPSVTAIIQLVEQMRFIDVIRLRDLLNKRFGG